MTYETDRTRTTGGSVEVRTLVTPSRAEIEQLAAIFDDYRAHYGEAASASTTASWLEKYVGGGCLEAFVATTDDEFIGFAITMAVPASQRLGHFWQIRDLYVSPPHRRFGIGGSLLDVIRAAATSAGALRLALQTEADNTSALRLYAERGYTIVEGYHSLTLPLKPEIPGN